MEVMIETCCGIDVHQKTIVCCVLDGPLDTNKPKKSYKIFGTRTSELRKALEWLVENEVTDFLWKVQDNIGCQCLISFLKEILIWFSQIQNTLRMYLVEKPI